MKYKKELNEIFDKIFKSVPYWLSKRSFLLGCEKTLEFLAKQPVYLSKSNPTHANFSGCGGVLNGIDGDGNLICSKCGETLQQYFDELVTQFSNRRTK